MKIIYMRDIVPRLMEEFPGVSREMIEAIVKEGCANITHMLVKGMNIDLSCKVERVRMLIYKPSKVKVKPKAESNDSCTK